jgi:hypothetical protein
MVTNFASSHLNNAEAIVAQRSTRRKRVSIVHIQVYYLTIPQRGPVIIKNCVLVGTTHGS